MIKLKKKELEEKLKLAIEFIKSAEIDKERIVYAQEQRRAKNS